MEQKSVISTSYNIVLFFYLICSGIAAYFFDSEAEVLKVVPWDEIFKGSPYLALVVASFIVIVLVFWGTALVRIFWNRFIADVFKIRTISFNEALAIILIFIIFSF